MRLRNLVVVVATFGIALGFVGTGMSSAGAASAPTYLALGDSLAASFQPDGDTHSGYAEQLFQLEQAGLPDLRLRKLACPGETTRTMNVAKPRCPYARGTQLAQAVHVLGHHDVAFVTVQIGSNDLFPCFRFRKAAFDQACVDTRLPRISERLTAIVQALRDAAGPDMPIVGGTYHDPLLFLWTIPGIDHGQVVANAGVWAAFNDMLEQTYAALGVPVADVAGAFSADDFNTVVHVRKFGDVPLNVARNCQWTYACSERFGHDPHPNTIGYAAMTRAWEAPLAPALAAPSP
jgi:lysophospholipase L1-like esterase